jgi:hypothetical protein
LIKVGNQAVGSFQLNYDVIYISLNGSPDEVPQNSKHTTLVRSPRIVEAKRHGYIAISPEQGDKRSHKLVRLFHHDLMVTGVSIKERESLTTQIGVNYLINAWQRKWMFRTSLIESSIINTHSLFTIFLFYKHRIS